MLRLRPARPDEGPALTAVCLRSKAGHGYDGAFMAACRDELTVEPDCPADRMIVAEDDGVPVGMAEVSFADGMAEIEKLFVEPQHFGKGIGRLLFEWAKAEADKQGARLLMIDADPGAAAFYDRMGAAMVGEAPSGSIPGRLLPRFQIEIGGGSEGR